jgi:DNA invertase Pin-like site-specific DNA recombinase
MASPTTRGEPLKGCQMAAAVIYRRVSTREQGNSGLGLEAQQATTEAYARQTGANIVGTYTEVETGKIADRPELKKALAHAKRSKATLIISKLDRLSRNVAFTSALLESGVPFVCCDNPHANKLTIHILAAIAEHEAEMISQRTKDALAAYKARGGKLGGQLPQCRNLSAEARRRGAERSGEVTRKAANEAYADIAPMMKTWRTEGQSLRDIAARLNAEGHSTRRGRPWNQVQVSRVLERAG